MHSTEGGKGRSAAKRAKPSAVFTVHIGQTQVTGKKTEHRKTSRTTLPKTLEEVMDVFKKDLGNNTAAKSVGEIVTITRQFLGSLEVLSFEKQKVGRSYVQVNDDAQVLCLDQHHPSNDEISGANGPHTEWVYRRP